MDLLSLLVERIYKRSVNAKSTAVVELVEVRIKRKY